MGSHAAPEQATGATAGADGPDGVPGAVRPAPTAPTAPSSGVQSGAATWGSTGAPTWALRTAGAGFVATGALALALSVVARPYGGEEADEIRSFAEDLGRAQAGSALTLLVLAALAVTCAAVRGVVRGRGERLGTAGLVLALPGLMAYSAVGSGLWQVTVAPVLDERARTAASTASGPVLLACVVVALAGTFVGVTLLMLALWRTGAVGWWLPVVWAVGFLLMQSSQLVVAVAAGLLLLAGFWTVAVRLFRAAAVAGDHG